jgi:hypothetical protein
MMFQRLRQALFSRNRIETSCAGSRMVLPDGFLRAVLLEAWPHDTIKLAARATGRHTRTVDNWMAGAEPGLGDVLALMAAHPAIWQRFSEQAGYAEASNVVLLVQQAKDIQAALNTAIATQRLPAAAHTRFRPPGAVDSAGSERGAAA